MTCMPTYDKVHSIDITRAADSCCTVVDASNNCFIAARRKKSIKPSVERANDMTHALNLVMPNDSA